MDEAESQPLTDADADRVRQELRESWERAAPQWGRQADKVRDWGMAASAWMIEHLDLQPGHRVLELAAGPGDTGFLAAELVRPGGVVICSDGAESMLDVARERASGLGVDNVEFKALQLEWIDLPTASVDGVLCRWGLMFALDPGAALQEARRVLRPGGRIAVAVWDAAERNPWATIPRRALMEAGHLGPPDPSVPSMFGLGESDRLADLFEQAGFVEVQVETVDLPRRSASGEQFLAETVALSEIVGRVWRELDEAQRQRVSARVAELTAPFTAADGSITLPARTLVACAEA